VHQASGGRKPIGYPRVVAKLSPATQAFPLSHADTATLA